MTVGVLNEAEFDLEEQCFRPGLGEKGDHGLRDIPCEEFVKKSLWGGQPTIAYQLWPVDSA